MDRHDPLGLDDATHLTTAIIVICCIVLAFALATIAVAKNILSSSPDRGAPVVWGLNDCGDA